MHHGEPVGLARLKRRGDNAAFNGYTGVAANYRGRGVARRTPAAPELPGAAMPPETRPAASLEGVHADDYRLLGGARDHHDRLGASVIAVMEMPSEEISNYGVVDPEPVDSDVVRVKRREEQSFRDCSLASQRVQRLVVGHYRVQSVARRSTEPAAVL